MLPRCRWIAELNALHHACHSPAQGCTEIRTPPVVSPVIIRYPAEPPDHSGRYATVSLAAPGTTHCPFLPGVPDASQACPVPDCDALFFPPLAGRLCVRLGFRPEGRTRRFAAGKSLRLPETGPPPKRLILSQISENCKEEAEIIGEYAVSGITTSPRDIALPCSRGCRPHSAPIHETRADACPVRNDRPPAGTERRWRASRTTAPLRVGDKIPDVCVPRRHRGPPGMHQ